MPRTSLDTPNNTPTPETVYCVRHPKVETGLTCASCGTPICPKCMVVTPVGMKCPTCGIDRNSPLYTVPPHRLLLACLAALLAGAFAGVLGSIAGFFVFFVSVPYGYFAGSMILRASGMKRGVKLEVLTGVCMVLGAVFPRLVLSLIATYSVGVHGRSALATVVPLLIDPYFWVAVIVSTSSAVSKIRYL